MALILVVDDDTISQRVLSHTLQKQGHRVVIAAQGRAALALLAEQRFELLITDLTMPEMDGLMLLRSVRADPALASLPVIMLTASGQDQDRQTAQAAGASDFLTKPTSSRELIEAVACSLGTGDR